MVRLLMLWWWWWRWWLLLLGWELWRVVLLRLQGGLLLLLARRRCFFAWAPWYLGVLDSGGRWVRVRVVDGLGIGQLARLDRSWGVVVVVWLRCCGFG